MSNFRPHWFQKGLFILPINVTHGWRTSTPSIGMNLPPLIIGAKVTKYVGKYVGSLKIKSKVEALN